MYEYFLKKKKFRNTGLDSELKILIIKFYKLYMYLFIFLILKNDKRFQKFHKKIYKIYTMRIYKVYIELGKKICTNTYKMSVQR